MDADIRRGKQIEEDDEYPVKIRQDLYTSNMEYSISDHKPVIGVFTLEVRTALTHCLSSWIWRCVVVMCGRLLKENLPFTDDFVYLWSCLSSSGRCMRRLWCTSSLRETGAQTSMPWLSTVLCSLSEPAHGTGSDSTRLALHCCIKPVMKWSEIDFTLKSRLDSPVC